MGRKTKLLFQGKEHEAEFIDVNQTNEYWNQYLLEDGTVLKLKPVATDVVRLVGAYDDEGNPIYVIKSKNIVSLSVPENLKRQG